jgi:hypothetical protein
VTITTVDASNSNATATATAQESQQFAGGTLEQVKEVLNFAKSRNKPIMIAESSPFGGINGDDLDDVYGYLPRYQTYKSELIEQRRKDVLHDDDTHITFDTWTLWFQPVLELIQSYDIAMWSYINCDWDSQPMWHDIGFGDTRLSSSPHIKMKWIDHVLHHFRRRDGLEESAVRAAGTGSINYNILPIRGMKAGIVDFGPREQLDRDIPQEYQQHVLILTTIVLIIIAAVFRRRNIIGCLRVQTQAGPMMASVSSILLDEEAVVSNAESCVRPVETYGSISDNL